MKHYMRISCTANELSNNQTELQIELPNKMIKTMKKYTSCPEIHICEYLTDEDKFHIILNNDKLLDTINTLNNIIDPLTEEEFWMKFITNNGSSMKPRDIHTILENEYHLQDDIEWNVALILIKLSGFVCNPAFCYRSIEEDMESDDCCVITIKGEKSN